MTDEPENPDLINSDSNDDIDSVTGGKPVKPRSGSALLISSPFVILIMAAIAFMAWISSAGIDMAWALGTSGWVAPPGSKLVGHDIGGKSFEEISDALDRISTDFSIISIWMSEPSFMVSIVQSEFSITTFADEIVIKASPTEIGLILDVNTIRREIAALNETAEDLWKFSDRIKMWQEPPSIDAKFMLDEEYALNYLNGVKSTVDTEPVNAQLSLAEHIIVPACDGIELDIEASLQNIPLMLACIADIPVELVINRIAPEITNDIFSEIDIENPLSSYTTSFSTWKRNRSRNIFMVAEHFNGVVIQPGEVFSFNETTGPRTFDEGYLAAPMYVRNRVELSPAGGACQVSTTLFNTALLAGLEIVERYPHSRPCSYVPYGRDATVAYETAVDLKFRNNLAHPVIINSVVDYTGAGTITYEIFGHPDDRVNVEITNSYSWLGRTNPTYVIDESLVPGEEVVEDSGTNGIYQRAWRTWFDDDGNEIRTEEVSNDRVRSIASLIRHNPSGSVRDYEPPPESSPDSDESQIYF